MCVEYGRSGRSAGTEHGKETPVLALPVLWYMSCHKDKAGRWNWQAKGVRQKMWTNRGASSSSGSMNGLRAPPPQRRSGAQSASIGAAPPQGKSRSPPKQTNRPEATRQQAPAQTVRAAESVPSKLANEVQVNSEEEVSGLESTAEPSRAHQEMERLARNKEEAERQLTELRVKFRDLDELNHELDKKVKDLNASRLATASRQASEIAALHLQQRQLERELRDCKSEFDEKRSQAADLQKKCAELEERNSRLDTVVQAMQRERGNFVERCREPTVNEGVGNVLEDVALQDALETDVQRSAEVERDEAVTRRQEEHAQGLEIQMAALEETHRELLCTFMTRTCIDRKVRHDLHEDVLRIAEEHQQAAARLATSEGAREEAERRWQARNTEMQDLSHDLCVLRDQHALLESELENSIHNNRKEVERREQSEREAEVRHKRDGEMVSVLEVKLSEFELQTSALATELADSKSREARLEASLEDLRHSLEQQTDMADKRAQTAESSMNLKEDQIARLEEQLLVQQRELKDACSSFEGREAQILQRAEADRRETQRARRLSYAILALVFGCIAVGAWALSIDAGSYHACVMPVCDVGAAGKFDTEQGKP